GIGKAMAANLCEMVSTGTMPIRTELLTKYKPTMLELLRLPGMGPKTVALVWSALGVADIDALEAAAKEGKLAGLPRMGEKFAAKLLKGIEDFRRNTGRFRIDQARREAERISELIFKLPLIDKLIARGQNKVSFNLRNQLQVDVRLLPRASYGAALQYFTGSKHHNVVLRQRAIKRGLTLNEYALLRLEDNSIVAAATEEEIYRALDLAFIPPELRENCGEIEAAAASFAGETPGLPELIELADIRGDLHMHTHATDGRDSIREMAEAAMARGLKYIAITDHS